MEEVLDVYPPTCGTVTVHLNSCTIRKKEEEVENWVKKEVKESVEFAENSPYPDGKELYEDVYKEDNYPYIIEY